MRADALFMHAAVDGAATMFYIYLFDACRCVLVRQGAPRIVRSYHINAFLSKLSAFVGYPSWIDVLATI